MSDEQYTDDTTIQDDIILWRRITKVQCIDDQNRGGKRPSSAAFYDHPNGTPMSVALEDVFFMKTSRDPNDYIKGYENVVALASFTAGFARELGQKIIRTPLPEEPAHAEVPGKKTGSVRKKFAKKAQWIIPPP